MSEYTKLIAERNALRERIRAYNERAYKLNERWCRCPDNCEYRGTPHTHTFRKLPFIRW